MENQQGPPPGLEEARALNKTIYQRLAHLRTGEESTQIMDWLPDFHNTYPRFITRLQGIYTQLLTEVENLNYMSEEGIVEVTVRSRTRSMSWPLNEAAAQAVSDALVEFMGGQLSDVMNKIIDARGRLASQANDNEKESEGWNQVGAEFLTLLLTPVPSFGVPPTIAASK